MKRLLLFLAASSLVLGGCRPASDSSVYDLGQHRKLQLDDHEAADYLDITVDLGGTFVSAAKTNHYGKKARTVIGGTGWYISGDFTVPTDKWWQTKSLAAFRGWIPPERAVYALSQPVLSDPDQGGRSMTGEAEVE
jgi:hypothetical protein